MSINDFHTIFNEHIGRNCKNKNSFTGKSLAQKIGVSEATISQWRRNGGQHPKPKMYSKILVAVVLMKMNTADCEKLFIALGGKVALQWLVGLHCEALNAEVSKLLKLGYLNEQEAQDVLDKAQCQSYQPCHDFVGEVPKEIPHFYNKKINYLPYFFGHAELLKRFRNTFWQSKDSLCCAAIIGPSHSGKSSLLYYLKNIDNIARHHRGQLRADQPQGWDDWLPENFKFVLVNLQDIRYQTSDGLLSEILKQLGFKIDKECTLANFTNTLRAQLKQPMVLLLDGLAAGLHSPHLDMRFWNHFRALYNPDLDLQISIVVTASRPLDQLDVEWSLDSPFFSLFSGNEERLKPFSEEESMQLINYHNPQMRHEDKLWICKQGAGWPARLHLLCREFHSAKQTMDIPSIAWRDKATQVVSSLDNLLDKNNVSK